VENKQNRGMGLKGKVILQVGLSTLLIFIIVIGV